VSWTHRARSVAALVMAAAAAPSVGALARDRGGRDGGRDGGAAAGGLVAGLALGAALGNYGGHPYYCREHRHWRWNARYRRYAYYNGGRC